MSTPKKLSKKEKEEPPVMVTPLRATITRAAKTKTPITEEKKVTRKHEEVAIRTRRGTPRKVKINEKETESSSDRDEKLERGGKHVKWVDKDGVTISEEKDIDKETQDDTEQEDQSKEDQKEDHKHEEQPKEEHKDQTHHERPDKKENIKEENIEINKDIHATSIVVEKHNEKVEDNGQQREQAIIRKYNQQWEAENKRRDMVTDQERQRRDRISRNIEQELQRNMQKECRLRESNKPQRISSKGSPLVLPDYTTGEVEHIENEVEEEDDGDADKAELAAKVDKAKSMIKEQNALIQVLEQTTHHLQEKVENEADTFNKARETYENEIKRLTERVRLIDYVSEALANETDLAEQNRKTIKQNEEKYAIEKEEFKNEIRQMREELERNNINGKLPKIDKASEEYKAAVAAGVRNTIRDMKSQRKARQVNKPKTNEAAANNSKHAAAGETESHPSEKSEHPNGIPKKERAESSADANDQIETTHEIEDQFERRDENGKRKRGDDDESESDEISRQNEEETDEDDVAVDLIEIERSPKSRTFEEVPDEPRTEFFGRKIRRIATQGAAVVAAATVVGFVHYANQISGAVLPHPTDFPYL